MVSKKLLILEPSTEVKLNNNSFRIAEFSLSVLFVSSEDEDPDSIGWMMLEWVLLWLRLLWWERWWIITT